MYIHGLKRTLHIVDEKNVDNDNDDDDNDVGDDNYNNNYHQQRRQSITASTHRAISTSTVTSAIDAIAIHRNSILQIGNENNDNNNYSNKSSSSKSNSTLNRQKTLTFVISNDGKGSSLVTTSSKSSSSLPNSYDDHQLQQQQINPLSVINYQFAPKFAGWLQIATRGETLGKILF